MTIDTKITGLIEERYQRALAEVKQIEVEAGLDPNAKSGPVSHRQMAAMLRVVADEIREMIDFVVAPLKARVTELEDLATRPPDE